MAVTKSKSKSTSKGKTSSKRTSSKKREPAVRSKAPASNAVHVDSTTARSDADVPVGTFAKVTKGKHQGRYGVVDTVVGELDKDGYPKKVLLRTRDSEAERLEVNYADLEPSVAGLR